MKRRITQVGVLSLLAIFGLQPMSCGILSSLTGAGGTGTLRLLVTDKPFPVDLITSAIVTITKIEVRQATSQPTSEPAEDGSGSGATSQPSENGFITIFEGEKSFDLLNLRNGKTDLLAETDIPAGTYDQMRLIVTNGKITLTDGRVFDLKVPSGEESGIKLNFDFDLPAVQRTTLILDVDLSRAFLAIPSGHIDDVSTITGFHFQPSLAMRLINVLEAGSISGHVTDAANGNAVATAMVTAFDGDTEVTTTVTDDTGAYTLAGLHTATYRVHVAASGFQDADVNGVPVTAGQVTANVDVALTATP